MLMVVTMRLMMMAQFSECCFASAASALAAWIDDFSDVPCISMLTSGSMPPSLAMVALLAGLFVARVHNAAAQGVSNPQCHKLSNGEAGD